MAAMDVLSHPFRLNYDGSVAVVDDSTSRANAEAIAVIVGTRPGERDLQPEFGIPDPAFDEVTPDPINACLSLYGPDGVSVSEVTTTFNADGSAVATLSFVDSNEVAV